MIKKWFVFAVVVMLAGSAFAAEKESSGVTTNLDKGTKVLEGAGFLSLMAEEVQLQFAYGKFFADEIEVVGLGKQRGRGPMPRLVGPARDDRLGTRLSCARTSRQSGGQLSLDVDKIWLGFFLLGTLFGLFLLALLGRLVGVGAASPAAGQRQHGRPCERQAE